MYQPLIYDPELPAGSRFVSKGLSPSLIPRMYHSVATLLPDGSVFVSGSNPNAGMFVALWVISSITHVFQTTLDLIRATSTLASTVSR